MIRKTLLQVVFLSVGLCWSAFSLGEQVNARQEELVAELTKQFGLGGGSSNVGEHNIAHHDGLIQSLGMISYQLSVRASNQDAEIAQYLSVQDKKYTVLGVYDGHGSAYEYRLVKTGLITRPRRRWLLPEKKSDFTLVAPAV